MNHPPLPYTRSEYAYRVYEQLAANQVGQDLCYDNALKISVAGVQALFHSYGTQITFPDPYTDAFVSVVVPKFQPPTAVAAVVEALLTTFASHLAFVAAEAAQARLREEV